MHREVRELLKEASGSSEFVFCVFVDVRDFTPFSKVVESPDVAIFIKRVFAKIIDTYFPDARYFKLMGDGLFLVLGYTEATLADVAPKLVETCFRLINDFPNFCRGDPMIYFSVPERLGIGISRGTACRIESGGKVLDYCGRILNLAARLMELARPSGIVLCGDYPVSLLPASLASQFAEERVLLRGIAENEPAIIYYTKNLTVLDSLDKRHLG